MRIVLLVFALINMATAAVFVWDKIAAKARWRRVPERRLVHLAFAGGGLGAFAAMALVRHKTQHRELRQRIAGAGLVGIALHVVIFWAVTEG